MNFDLVLQHLPWICVEWQFTNLIKYCTSSPTCIFFFVHFHAVSSNFPAWHSISKLKGYHKSATQHIIEGSLFSLLLVYLPLVILGHTGVLINPSCLWLVTSFSSLLLQASLLVTLSLLIDIFLDHCIFFPNAFFQAWAQARLLFLTSQLTPSCNVCWRFKSNWK